MGVSKVQDFGNFELSPMLSLFCDFLYFSAFLMEVQLDMGDGFVLSKSAENITKIGQIPHASLPGLGETLTIELEEAPNDLKSCSMKFSRNEEVIGKVQVPRHRFIPSLESTEGLSVMIHPLLQEVLN